MLLRYAKLDRTLLKTCNSFMSKLRFWLFFSEISSCADIAVGLPISWGCIWRPRNFSGQRLFLYSLTNLTEDDLLGTFSLIFWTLTLLVLVKYVFIVLHANDHGEGGTFALYSYLCRHINLRSKLTFHSVRMESDEGMAHYSQAESGSPLCSKTKKFLERSSAAQNFLTFVVLLGTCMVIGDGALTPATCGNILPFFLSPSYISFLCLMCIHLLYQCSFLLYISVLSALQGIQSLSPKITQGKIDIILRRQFYRKFIIFPSIYSPNCKV